MERILIGVVTVLLSGAALDGFLMPRPRRRPDGAGMSVALAAALLLYAAWFALSWRPLFSGVAASVTLACLAGISLYKRQVLGDPLAFADFFLIPQILRHPLLYHAEFLRRPWFFAAVGALLGIIAAWWAWLEPSLLPVERPSLAWFGLAGAVALAAWAILAAPLPAPVRNWIARAHPQPDLRRDVARFGLSGSLLVHSLAWRASAGAAALQRPRPGWPALGAPAAPPPVVICVQSESFVDLRAAGRDMPDLPCLGAARARALAHGRLTVPTEGAWTMRSEFVALTGLSLSALGLDAIDPYLRAAHDVRDSLASRFRSAGYRTIFVHPFDLDFFGRRRLMPKLGFAELLGEEDFRDAPREGYFVADSAVCDRLLDIAETSREAVFAFVVTMENHNPWQEGRIPGLDDPTAQYLHHLRNADRMLGRLVSGLDRLDRPGLLLFYGDHTPIAPAILPPLEDGRTDYVLVETGPGARRPRRIAAADRDIAELPGLLLGAAADLSASSRERAPEAARQFRGGATLGSAVAGG